MAFINCFNAIIIIISVTNTFVLLQIKFQWEKLNGSQKQSEQKQKITILLNELMFVRQCQRSRLKELHGAVGPESVYAASKQKQTNLAIGLARDVDDKTRRQKRGIVLLSCRSRNHGRGNIAVDVSINVFVKSKDLASVAVAIVITVGCCHCNYCVAWLCF